MVIKLKKIREERSITPKALAEMLNTTEQIIENWESGATLIPESILKDLGIIFSCGIDEILGLKDQGWTGYTAIFAREFERKHQREITGNYGGVKLTLTGLKEEKDYPLDEKSADFLCRSLPDISDEPCSALWVAI